MGARIARLRTRHVQSDVTVVGAFMARARCVAVPPRPGGGVAARGTRWRWGSDAWALARKAETDRWDPVAEYF
jgi:hypothetical protein